MEKLKISITYLGLQTKLELKPPLNIGKVKKITNLMLKEHIKASTMVDEYPDCPF